MALPTGTTIYEWTNSGETPSSVYTTTLTPTTSDSLYDIYGNVLFTVGMFESGSIITVYSSDLEKFWERDYSDTSSTTVQGLYVSTVTHSGTTYILKDAEARANLATKQNLIALNEGEILTDTSGYNALTKYLYDTFDWGKFSIKGSLTTTESGTATGFSSSNYITADVAFPANAADFVLNLPAITLTSNPSANNVLIQPTVNNQNIGLGINTSRKTFLYMWNSSYSTISSGTIGSLTYSLNTKYYMRLTYNGSTYKLQRSTDNITWETDTQVNSSSKLASISTYNLGTNVIQTAPFAAGTLDLKPFSLIVGGSTVFTSNTTGTDTYTINNTTVSIPYRISLTGDKVAESSYRTDVNNVFLAKGLAPYFTIDETNKTYTLPQGELYGMFIDRTTSHLIKSYRNGTEWYKIWSSDETGHKWCEQGGFCNSFVNEGYSEVYFLVEYPDINYSVFSQLQQQSTYSGTFWGFCQITYKQPDYFVSETLKERDPYSGSFGWRAIGYL